MQGLRAWTDTSPHDPEYLAVVANGRRVQADLRRHECDFASTSTGGRGDRCSRARVDTPSRLLMIIFLTFKVDSVFNNHIYVYPST
jgi:hypothetical protein